MVSGVNMVLTYPVGALGDKFHPLRVLLWVKVINPKFAGVKFVL
jgi:hypothetical protein